MTEEIISFPPHKIWDSLQPIVTSHAWKKAKHLALDYDGVVAHTEPYQMLAFMQTAIAQSPGQSAIIEFQALAREMIGKPEEVILGILKERHDISMSVTELLEVRAEKYITLAKQHLTPNPYALELVRHARSEGKHCFVLSNGRSNVLGALNDFWGISGLFSEMQTIDRRTIKDKVGYLCDRARRNNHDPASYMVFEDSSNTIRAARAAGISGVFFVHELSQDPAYAKDSEYTLPCIEPWSYTKQGNAARITILSKMTPPPLQASK